MELNCPWVIYVTMLISLPYLSPTNPSSYPLLFKILFIYLGEREINLLFHLIMHLLVDSLCALTKGWTHNLAYEHGTLNNWAPQLRPFHSLSIRIMNRLPPCCSSKLSIQPFTFHSYTSVSGLEWLFEVKITQLCRPIIYDLHTSSGPSVILCARGHCLLLFSKVSILNF